MKALILAGGFGNRLHPITKTIPKCLVEINGRPLLDYWIEKLVNAGVYKILVNTHWLANKVEDYILTSKWAKYVDLVYEDKLLGTGGTLLNNIESLLILFLILLLSVIKKEKTSAISSEAIDLEYSVRNPFVLS